MRLLVPVLGALAAAAIGAAAAFAMNGGPRQHLAEQTGLTVCKSGQIERLPAVRAGVRRFVVRSGPRSSCKAVIARSLRRAASDQCPDASARRGGCAFGFGAHTVTVIRFQARRGRSDRYLVRTT
jgi:hypothetical protein